MLDTDFAQPGRHTDRTMEREATFTHPDDVLRDRSLSPTEKRTILAAWASDAHAVPNRPVMRQIGSGAIVDIDTVLTALRALDAGGQAPSFKQGSSARDARILLKTRSPRSSRRGPGNDDDPPPCPAAALPPHVELALQHRRQAAWGLAAA